MSRKAAHQTYIGIDPGITGGIAVITPVPQGAITGAWTTPTLATKHGRDFDREVIVKMLGSLGGTRYAAIEHVNAAPMHGRRQGTKSMFAFGRGFGLWLGILEGLGIPVIEVDPRRWKRVVLKGLGTDKQAAIRYCEMFFAERSLLATPRCRTPHHGIADALCIAEYGRRTWEERLLVATVGATGGPR